MRIALVSPYSWTYPGGVTRHIEALAEQYLATGHDVRVLAPVDPADRLSSRLHAGATPVDRELPEWLIPLGRTIGVPSNGAVSNLSPTPSGVSTMRRELRAGGFDVVHLHEPVAPTLAWDALCSTDTPTVGTFHCYSASVVTNNIANLLGARRRLNHLQARIAVSEAAAWTGRRFYGGRYRIIPNGVHIDPTLAAQATADLPTPERPLRLAFVGQAVERKGLPVLLRAFEALREHLPVRLYIVGVTAEQLEPMMMDATGVVAHGKCSDEIKRQVLEEADLLCAPSLGGESFGMVLTEGFAAGTAVVASDIAGYRDVVRHGVDGILVPRADATALAQTLRDLALDPPRRAALSAAAAQSAHRYAWPRVAEQVLDTYADAMAVPAPTTTQERAATMLGLRSADGEPREPARRLPSLEPELAPGERSRGAALARRAAVGIAALLAAVMVVLAVQRIGLHEIKEALLAATPIWVIFGLGIMCSSMILRGVAWHAILQAALPASRIKRTDALQGTCIGVLMSATLPARLGEPSRALIVARRIGSARNHLPVVLGTIVSQTLINVVALVILGITMFSTVDFFSNNKALLAFTLAPMAILMTVLLLPALLRRGKPTNGSAVGAGLRRVANLAGQARNAMIQVRAGLQVFRHPRLGPMATALQLSAWALQWLSCYVLLIAFGLEHEAGLGAAAAVLFAVNITAVLPATPSNLGVFQAACVAVLTAYGVSTPEALAYGIMLQAVEIATAVIMGAPALVKEGLSWKDVRLRALHGTPVELAPLHHHGAAHATQRTGEFASPSA